jgi:hypothetical protein
MPDLPEHPDSGSVAPSVAFNHLASILSEVQSAIADRRYDEAQAICGYGIGWAQEVAERAGGDNVAFLAVTAQQLALKLDVAIIGMVNGGNSNQIRGYLYEVGDTVKRLAGILPMAALYCAHERPSWDGVLCISEQPCPPGE